MSVNMKELLEGLRVNTECSLAPTGAFLVGFALVRGAAGVPEGDILAFGPSPKQI